MKMIRFLGVAMLVTAFLSSCKKDDPTVAQYAKLKISFSNEIDGQPIVLGPLNYTNKAGNQYSVDLLKYYVTNFTLVKADGSETNFKNYALIDASDSSKFYFALDSVMNGDYTSIKFLLGVDSAHNHTLVQGGALDPSNAMIWSWNTGYIFFKHEGNYKNAAGNTRSLVFHYGTDNALVPITIPIPKLTVAGKGGNIHLKFNLNSVYTSPTDIDFNVDNFHQSTDAGDIFWIGEMKDNIGDAFSYERVDWSLD